MSGNGTQFDVVMQGHGGSRNLEAAGDPERLDVWPVGRPPLDWHCNFDEEVRSH